MQKKNFIIVTGMSGAGKTLTSKILEDFNFFCVDNLPPALIHKFFNLCLNSNEKQENFAIVVDTRSKEYFHSFKESLEEMDKEGLNYKLIFLDATDDVILRRYKETRRPHPMDKNALLSSAISMEREIMADIKKKSHIIIDTSNLKRIDLEQKLKNFININEKNEMIINILSFGFKFGIPQDADLVLDVRFLPNPFYVEKLRHSSGTVKEVENFILDNDITKEFLGHLDTFIEFLIPQYINEKKASLTIAIGCTGGMHRSVFVSAHLYKLLKQKYNFTHFINRDLYKNNVVNHNKIEIEA